MRSPGRYRVTMPSPSLAMFRPAAPGAATIYVSGYAGPALPPELDDPEFSRAGDGASRRSSWRLLCRQGEFAFEAVAVDAITERPELYAPLHERFALRRRDRLALRLLLWLLRLPGGGRLMRRWHARRS